MLPRELYRKSVVRLEENGVPDADLEAALLLEYLFGIKRVDLILSERRFADHELEKFEESLRRRIAREPLSYIVREKEFWSLPFRVTPSVLIPRPETELLVEEVLALVENHNTYQGRMLDLGTGSGVIPVVLALELPLAKVFASDLSFNALEVAWENMVRHNVADRVFLMNGNWLSHLRSDCPFAIIISNPPYVAVDSRAQLQPELDFEPEMALYGGRDGLDAYRTMIPESRRCLQKGGMLVMEIGYDQEEMVRDIFSESPGMELVKIRKDYSGQSRIAVGRAI
ncbi:MAG: peptide chain release factor N(5)-glutamine methyltransferase [Proteobacteria bacterium]|nr:peptide chain release factor N(5)-glutamine methyltransferase [Pseudomonadota bacterium]MBU1738731.1 peptide chain release factor N(5)-glutamine methyltransferase [Pseudomonadota bacterium]